MSSTETVKQLRALLREASDHNPDGAREVVAAYLEEEAKRYEPAFPIVAGILSLAAETLGCMKEGN